MSRIADSQQMWFWWSRYRAVNTCQISMRPNLEEATARFFVVLPDVFTGSTQLRRNFPLAETWCDCEWTHRNRRPLAICRRLWKYSLALHVGEIPLAAFPLWFRIIYEGSSGGKGYPPQVSISLYDISWMAAEQQFLNVFTARQNPSGWGDKCQKTHIWAEYKGSKALSQGKSRWRGSKEHRRKTEAHWEQKYGDRLFGNVFCINVFRYWCEGQVLESYDWVKEWR